MTTLRQHIDGLDMQTWAALTKRTVERAVAAAEQLGQEPPAQLAAVAGMSEAQLIEHRQKNTWKAQHKRPTARMKLIEADYQRVLAEQRADDAQQDKEDAVADAAAARAEAHEAAAATEAARERARAALDDLAGKELQRTTERRATQAELESLRVEFDRFRADATAARAEAKESAKAAEAARERERAALDELARKGAQHAGEQRKVHAARAALENLRGELDQVRADAQTQIAASRAEASAAQERAEQRLGERAKERREAQAALERWRGELERVRADADSEVATAREQVSAAEDRAHQRMAERAADRVSSQQALEQLQAQLASVRADAAAQVDAAREQAALAIASAQQDMDDTLARVRARAAQHLEEALQARARVEADADGARAQAQTAAQGLTIPIPPWEVRPETKRIENALTTLHQINYVLEVGMAEEVEAHIPLDPELVWSLVRTVQGQAKALGQEFGDLPARFSADSQVQAAASYADAAARACRALLRRIGTAAQQLGHRDSGPGAEVIAAVMSMLADPQVQDLVPQP